MGKYQRTKGHNFERWVAKALRIFYPDAKRGFQTRGGGAEEADVINTPFHIECKVGKSHNIRKAWEQARDDTNGDAPIAVCKEDRKEILVTMEWSTFMEFLELREQEAYSCNCCPGGAHGAPQ